MGVLAAQDFREDLIGGRDPGAGVHHEKADVGHLDRAFGQAAHPALQAVVARVF